MVKLRGQSIQGQLDGSIPSTEEAQRSSDALVDASTLDISVMGSMNTGGGGGGFGFNAPTASENHLRYAGCGTGYFRNADCAGWVRRAWKYTIL